MSPFSLDLPAALREAVSGQTGTRLSGYLRCEGLAGLAPELGAPTTGPVSAWLAQSMVLDQACAEAAGALAAEGIDVLVLKGAALRQWLYPEPRMRMMSDIDLLVREWQREPAVATIQRLGYRPGLSAGGAMVFWEQQFLRRSGEFEVPLDLHWTLNTNPVLRQRLSFDELWHRRRCLRDGSWGLSPGDALLHAVMHRAPMPRTDRDRLVWLLDIHLLWTRMTRGQRQRVTELALDRGLAGLLLDGLNACRQQLDTEVAADIRRALDQAAVGEKATRLLYLDHGPRRLAFELSHLPRRVDALVYLAQMAFPPKSYMQRRYGSARLRTYLSRLIGGVRKLFGAKSGSESGAVANSGRSQSRKSAKPGKSA